MKLTSNPWKLSTLVLAGAIAAGAAWSTIGTAQADAQPKMEAALAHLRNAKQALEGATSDKGGHRVKAIQQTNEAIESVKKGIEFDNKH